MNGYELVRLQPQQVSKTGDTMTGNLTMSGGAKFVGNLTGNADTATKLQTARTINGTSFNGTANITTANWGTARTITIGSTGKSVNGSGNVSWSLSEIGAAAASHSHSLVTGINDTRSTEYTPSTVRRDFKVTFQNNGTNGVSDGGTYYSLMHIPRWSDNAGGFGSQFAFTDNDNVWYRRGTSDTAWGTWRKIWHSGNFDPNSKANSSHTHNYAGSSSAGGNANAAVKLATARTINGTNFDGTGNITTANWGTARTITIGSTGKSVNGSGNISWSLSEIGAAATSHTHNYAGSSSAGGAANSATKLATARTINGVAFDGTANITVPMSGTATSANQLATARTINGTSFNGTANIVTSYWGTARTITIGNTGKSVNGSANISWSLSEIGAASASHNHTTLTSVSSINFTNATITNSSASDTLQIDGTTNGLAAIKLSSGGCRVYGTNSSTKLYVEGGIYTNNIVESTGVYSNGTVRPTKNAQAGWDIGSSSYRYYTLYGVNTNLSSDRSMKEDIHYLDNGIALLSTESEKSTPFKDFICNDLKIATYKYKRQIATQDEDGTIIVKDVDHEPEDSQIGFIAQDIRNTEVGSMFVYGEDGNMNYSPSGFTTVIARALQEEIKSRDSEIEELKSKIDSLEEQINSILEAVTK